MTKTQRWIVAGTILAAFLLGIGGSSIYLNNQHGGIGQNNQQGTPGQLSVTSVSGPTSLAVGQNGIWKVSVENASSSEVFMNVDWGDNSDTQLPQSKSSVGQEDTFTYSNAYDDGGVYDIIITAQLYGGESVSTTTEVTVTGQGPDSSPTDVSFNSGPSLVSGLVSQQFEFTTHGSGGLTGETVNFGDGTSGKMRVVVATCPFSGPTTNCGPYSVVLHTYQSPGTYVATLLSPSGSTLGNVEITVTESPIPPIP
jgi:hypothetical protein